MICVTVWLGSRVRLSRMLGVMLSMRLSVGLSMRLRAKLRVGVTSEKCMTELSMSLWQGQGFGSGVSGTCGADAFKAGRTAKVGW